jgi:hypothetical protein
MRPGLLRRAPGQRACSGSTPGWWGGRRTARSASSWPMRGWPRSCWSGPSAPGCRSPGSPRSALRQAHYLRGWLDDQDVAYVPPAGPPRPQKGNQPQQPGHDRLRRTGDPPPVHQPDPSPRTRPPLRLVLVHLAATPIPGPSLPLPAPRQCTHLTAVAVLVRQQHFVVFGLSSLVVACSGTVLVGAAPAGPVPCGCAAGDLGDQVCQETADLAERDCDEAAARAFGALAAVTAR